MKPISPKEAHEKKRSVIPDGVIEAINQLIVENLGGQAAIVKQKDIRLRACSIMQIQEKDFLPRWLDFEEVYRREGWKVSYDKPGYNETYDAFFKFEAPRTRGCEP